MRRLICAFAAVLGLAGCSASSSTSKPMPTSSASAIAAYLEAARPLAPSTNSDEDLLNVGHSFCDVFTAGGDYQTLLSRITSNVSGANSQNTAREIRVAVRYLCPQFSNALPSSNP